MSQPTDRPNQSQQNLFYPLLKDQLNPKHPLYELANKLDWEALEKELLPRYSHTGRPAKSIRLMAGLLLLKQLDNLGDETVIEKWLENPYYQYFCGMDVFQWHPPVDPSDFVYFRKRLGEEGLQRIFKLSIDVHGEAAVEDQVVADTTVQHKAIRFPTDSRLYMRSLEWLWRIAKQEEIKLKQSYKRVAKQLMWDQFKGNLPNRRKKARKSQKALRVRAGRVLREVQRKLSPEALERHGVMLERITEGLAQQRKDKNKIYSLHAPEVACIAKGKAFPQYEFGSKVSIMVGKERGIVLAVKAFMGNPYDGDTLQPTLDVFKKLHKKNPTDAIVDRGYRKKKIGQTNVHVPSPSDQDATRRQKEAKRQMFRRRAAIEPRIGHLKHHHGLHRNWLKGRVGDRANLLLAAAAYNLRLWMIDYQRKLKQASLAPIFTWLRAFTKPLSRLLTLTQTLMPKIEYINLACYLKMAC